MDVFSFPEQVIIMKNTDIRIDQYILNSQPFAQEILNHLRFVIHNSCPEVKETMKWSMPFFEYSDANLCSMAAFKQHCAFGFWLASKMTDPKGHLKTGTERTAMGHLGRITSLKDLPNDKILKQYIKEAMQLIDQGEKLNRPVPVKSSKELSIPVDFKKALVQNKKAGSTFKIFSYSQQKEYINWITEAKTEPTRQKRIDTSIEWLSQGKIRNWKYVKK